MRKNEIQVRGEYYISSHRYKGRAVVTGPAERRRSLYSTSRPVYRFPVEFPDSVKDGKPETEMIEGRDFSRPWTQEDEDRFQRMMAESAEMDNIRERMNEAGYPLDYVRRISGELRMAFVGDDVVQRVIERLTT